jgi:hypothetical protein
MRLIKSLLSLIAFLITTSVVNTADSVLVFMIKTYDQMEKTADTIRSITYLNGLRKSLKRTRSKIVMPALHITHIKSRA